MTLLLADDEKHVLDTLKSMLDLEGLGIARVIEAENGLDALERIRAEKPQVVITDIRMPFLDGIGLMRESKKIGFDGKFIILSGYDLFEYAREAIRHGAFDYLLKPINPFELNETVRRAAPSAPNAAPEPSYLDKIKEYIETNYATDIRLDDFVHQYFMTKEYILRKFTEKYSMGIYEYVMQLRMGEAKRLLTETELQIQTIAYRVGFNDNHYFSKAFKRHFGVTPKAMRKGEDE